MTMPLPRPAPARRKQLGSAAIAAIAVIVLVGLIGSALVSSLRIGSRSQTSLLQATQAFFIADAGIEWACKQNSPTPFPMTLANGTFTVTSAGGQWVSLATVGDTRCTFRCQPLPAGEPISHGLDSVTGSRAGSDQFSAKFLVLNSTDSPITFNSLTPAWGDTAYFEQVNIRVLLGTDYGTAWHYTSNGNLRWGDAENEQFNQIPSATIPAHRTMEIELKNFSRRRNRSNPYNIKDSSLTVTFFNGAANVGQVNIDTAPN